MHLNLETPDVNADQSNLRLRELRHKRFYGESTWESRVQIRQRHCYALFIILLVALVPHVDAFRL
jgi:hypothetical protein